MNNQGIFSVGQTVFCLLYGEAEVIGVDNGCIYGVSIRYKRDDTVRNYTHNGSLYEDGRRVLFFSDLIPTEEMTTPPRWRAEINGTYFSVLMEMGRAKPYAFADYRDEVDNSRFTTGVYYKTKEEAMEVSNEIDKVIKKHLIDSEIYKKEFNCGRSKC